METETNPSHRKSVEPMRTQGAAANAAAFESGASRYLPFRTSTRIFVATAMAVTGLIFFAGNCAVGPDYEPPVIELPQTWGWKKASPADNLDPGQWWKIFNDPDLNTLQELTIASSPDLRMAVARLDQVRALAGLSTSQYWPTINANAQVLRHRTSPNVAYASPLPLDIPALEAADRYAFLDLSYELDVFGRVRRQNEATDARVAASEADFRTVLIGLSAQVSGLYFQLRSEDAEVAALAEAVENRRIGLNIFKARYANGVIDELDLSRAKTEYSTALSTLEDAKRRREQTENQLAILCGQFPQNFKGRKSGFQGNPPELTVGLPSTLLERRPDVAAAERRLAAANADIGVAKAAFFPSLSLTADAGLRSEKLSELLRWDSRAWSYGAGVRIPIFDAGSNQARLDASRAAHMEAQANYEKTVLGAFQEVDDALSALQYLRSQELAQRDALQSSRRASQLARIKYRAGAASYLDVIEADRSRLQNEIASIRIREARYLATIRLIKALGGGWQMEGPKAKESDTKKEESSSQDSGESSEPQKESSSP